MQQLVIFIEVVFKPIANSNSKTNYHLFHNHELSYLVRLTCSNMHENAIFRFFGFFLSFYIYNLSYLELRLNFYEFLKFATFSGIFYIRINPEKDLLRQRGVSVMSAVN